MRIEHIAVWTDDIEAMRAFYLKYFDVTCGPKYVNASKGYTSYFLTFDGSGARIELMNRPDVDKPKTRRGMSGGWAHISISVGSPDTVNMLTERFRADGFSVIGEPRTSGDGYYESVVADPEGNYLELLGV